MSLETIIVSIIIVIDLLLWSLLIILNRRNTPVYEQRMKIIKEISALAQNDIWMDEEFMWRWKGFDEDVSYDRMLFTFWRPVESFYENAPYLR